MHGGGIWLGLGGGVAFLQTSKWIEPILISVDSMDLSSDSETFNL